jgi:3-dehydrosphinganine reductase
MVVSMKGRMFRDKITIITGGSSGIGKVLAHRLFARGARLAIIARDKNKLHSVKKELTSLPAAEQAVEVFPCDISDATAVEKTTKAIGDTQGPPDILINSAGILKEGYFENLSIDTFHEIMNINFFGTLQCIKAVLPYFKQKGKGRIVNICSMGGLIGAFGYTAYCSSKYAITGLTNTLRAELQPQNIRIHLVCPPEFDSPMVDQLETYRTPENRLIVRTIPVLDVNTVADAIIRGIEEDRYEIIPGLPARMARLTDRLFPSLSRKVVDYRIKKIYQGPDK